MLDCVDLEVAPQPDGRPLRPNTVIERCKAAWVNFKSFNQDTTVSVMTHALVVVQSHYPAIDLRAIGARFAKGTSATKQQQLEDEVEDAAKKLVGDVNLFGEVDGEGQTQ